MSSDSIYDFKNPPITEAVCGIAFRRLERFLAPHMGLLWALFRKDYPRVEEKSPLTPPKQAIHEDESDSLVGIIGRPRIWFVREDETRLIQVQQDRFLHNWKKVKTDDEYPRYGQLIEEFPAALDRFRNFVETEGLGNLEPIQYELTYVNVISEGEGFECLGRIGELLPDFRWRREGNRFLSKPDGINWTSFFPMAEESGRLRVTISDGRLKATNKPVIRLMLTAQGLPKDTAPEAMRAWFDLAREWIVRAFVDLTSESVQSDHWGRVYDDASTV
jgi:uncharacterized protein (TIGR04255 family)